MYQLIYNYDGISRLDSNGNTVIPPGGTGWSEYQEWLKAGNVPLPADVPPPPGYRELRAAAYIKQLSPEGTFQTSVGDLIDALIKAAYGDRSELDDLVSKITRIKQEYPGG